MLLIEHTVHSIESLAPLDTVPYRTGLNDVCDAQVPNNPVTSSSDDVQTDSVFRGFQNKLICQNTAIEELFIGYM